MGLTQKITVYLLLVSFIVLAFTFSLQYHSTYLQVTQRSNEKVSQIATRLSGNLYNSLNEYDFATLRSTVNSEFLDSSLDSVLIFDLDKKKKYYGVKKIDGKLIEITSKTNDRNLIEFESYIQLKNKKIGIVYLSLNPKIERGKAINNMYLQFISLILILSIFLVIFLFISSFFIISPLNSIRQAMKKLEIKDIHLSEVDEIFFDLNKKLSGSFAEMKEFSDEYIRMMHDLHQKNLEIAENENSLEITLNSIGDAVIATNESGKIERMNPIAEKLTGWKVEDALGHPLEAVLQLINQNTRKNITINTKSLNEKIQISHNAALISKDCKEKQISIMGNPILNLKNKQVGMVYVFRDTTDQYLLEEQLRQAQKLDSIGQLAGGVAHDFNNSLHGIIGLADIINKKVSDNKVKDFIKLLKDTAINSAELTSKLLSFSRKSKVEKTFLHIHELLKDTSSILQRSIDKKIDIQLLFYASEDLILGDKAILQNSFINLGVNARDAMKGKGTLTIKTDLVIVSEENKAEYSYLEKFGEFIHIAFVDTGTGIDPLVLNKIFEPFFTTKEIGKGTGLGLSTVYGCIKDHHGAIHVESELNKGTTFHVMLPLVKEKIEDAKLTNNDLKIRNATILVIDDDPIVRTISKSLLMDLGFVVLEAENGLDGVDIYQKNKEQIDIILLDAIMPKMNGEECLKQIRSINPLAKIILSSGYTQGLTLEDMADSLGANAFIHKPFELDELCVIIDHLLNN